MLDYLRKHTIVIMAAMALVFVGLMFVGGDVSGGSLTGMFKQTFVSVDGKSYGEKDYNNMGRTGLSVAFSFPSTFGPLLQDNFSSEKNLRELCHLLKTNNPNAAFLAYRGIIRREAGRLGLTPSTTEIDDAICKIPEFQDDKGVFDPKKYDNFISMRGNMGKKLQEELLRGLMEDTISLERIRDVLTGGISVESGFAEAVAESNSQQITINTAFLEKSAFRPKTDPGEEEIKTFWDKHKENYKNEEARFFTVYTFIPAGNALAPKPGDISNATMETMNLVENDIWEPLNATNGRNMDQAISEALAKAPGVCKMEKKSYTAVTRKNAPQEINQTINQSASDGRSANLLDVAFSLTGAPALNADADAKAIEEARAKTGAEQISTMQVLENGQVVLIRLEGVTPVKALPYETARNSARADLLESMTIESMNKAATELNTELQKAEKPMEQFNAIAGKAGAKTGAYGPFINPNALLSSVNLQNAKTLERAMNSRLAPPKELPAPEEVFQAVSVINPGQMAQPINTGDGILLTQLVKRELEDTPEFQIKATQQIAPALTAQAKSMIMLDWLKACITQYKVEIAPILNQER
ncbi:SurA N-terminal domain-containing protein [uncultured Akkermansia sp.]|uniref:SurA N-terminal domain-containing protein n=1 Tax=uncultured Akkermansia sp. TaxID=512294 RepID=UPI0026294722|nr:SurA N-terminal domain-containing protein [uncultured Akkermansia sp.]